MSVLKKCEFKPMNFADGEFGCPLDHCSLGHHVYDVDGKTVHVEDMSPNECKPPDDDCSCPDEVTKFQDLCRNCRDECMNEGIRAAERAAGWDPNP